jgi:hypothetical protein
MTAPPSYRVTVVSGRAVPLDARLEAFLGYWQSKRGGRAMPRRTDLDPTEMPRRLLPYLYLTDVVDAGARFRYRLMGTAAVTSVRADLTGRYLDEITEAGRYRDYVTALYRLVLARRRPVFSMSHYIRFGPAAGAAPETRPSTQRLMCPLSSDGLSVDQVVSCQVYDPASGADAFPDNVADDSFTIACEAVLE